MRYQVRVLINDGPGRFWRYAGDGDRLTGGAFMLVDGATAGEACDKAFHVGNRMSLDATGREYPKGQRSVSVGDVLALRLENSRSDPLYFSCANAGWTEEEPDDVARSLVYGLSREEEEA